MHFCKNAVISTSLGVFSGGVSGINLQLIYPAISEASSTCSLSECVGGFRITSPHTVKR